MAARRVFPESLPVLDFVAAQFSNLLPSRLASTHVVASQHVLETAHPAVHTLLRLGVPAANISLIGKCYSTDKDVFHALRAPDLGVHVADSCLEFDSHVPYREAFAGNVRAFAARASERLRGEDEPTVVFLDDGAYLHTAVHELLRDDPEAFGRRPRLAGVEQTSSGWQVLSQAPKLVYPIFNVARSHAKLVRESPLIAQASVDQIWEYIDGAGLPDPEQIFVLGGGPIGQDIATILRLDSSRGHSAASVVVGDHDPAKSDRGLESIAGALAAADLVVGATGVMAVPDPVAACKPGAILASVSSSDAEFNGSVIRRAAPRTNDWETHITGHGLHLPYCGFPITFARVCAHGPTTEEMQLTMGLLLYGVLQGIEHAETQSGARGLVTLPNNHQADIIAAYDAVMGRQAV